MGNQGFIKYLIVILFAISAAKCSNNKTSSVWTQKVTSSFVIQQPNDTIQRNEIAGREKIAQVNLDYLPPPQSPPLPLSPSLEFRPASPPDLEYLPPPSPSRTSSIRKLATATAAVSLDGSSLFDSVTTTGPPSNGFSLFEDNVIPPAGVVPRIVVNNNNNNNNRAAGPSVNKQATYFSHAISAPSQANNNDNDRQDGSLFDLEAGYADNPVASPSLPNPSSYQQQKQQQRPTYSTTKRPVKTDSLFDFSSQSSALGLSSDPFSTSPVFAPPAIPQPPAIPFNDDPAPPAPPVFIESAEGQFNQVSLTWAQLQAMLTPSTDVASIISSITSHGASGGATVTGSGGARPVGPPAPPVGPPAPPVGPPSPPRPPSPPSPPSIIGSLLPSILPAPVTNFIPAVTNLIPAVTNFLPSRPPSIFGAPTNTGGSYGSGGYTYGTPSQSDFIVPPAQLPLQQQVQDVQQVQQQQQQQQQQNAPNGPTIIIYSGSSSSGQQNPPAAPTFNPPSFNPPSQNSYGSFNPPAQNPTPFNPPAQNNYNTFNPPAQNPTSFNPPVQNYASFNPPAQNPPTFNPPTQNYGSNNPPAQSPPTFNPPAQNYGSNNPPAQSPPTFNPPAQNSYSSFNPPAQNPPAFNPPSAPNYANFNPPVQSPPTFNPPALNSYGSFNPPAQNPPTFNPPTQNYGSNNPPAQGPPTFNPPAQNYVSNNPPAQSPPTFNPPAQNSYSSFNPPAQNPTSFNPSSQNYGQSNPSVQNPPSQNYGNFNQPAQDAPSFNPPINQQFFNPQPPAPIQIINIPQPPAPPPTAVRQQYTYGTQSIPPASPAFNSYGAPASPQIIVAQQQPQQQQQNLPSYVIVQQQQQQNPSTVQFTNSIPSYSSPATAAVFQDAAPVNTNSYQLPVLSPAAPAAPPVTYVAVQQQQPQQIQVQLAQQQPVFLQQQQPVFVQQQAQPVFLQQATEPLIVQQPVIRQVVQPVQQVFDTVYRPVAQPVFRVPFKQQKSKAKAKGKEGKGGGEKGKGLKGLLQRGQQQTPSYSPPASSYGAPPKSSYGAPPAPYYPPAPPSPPPQDPTEEPEPQDALVSGVLQPQLDIQYQYRYSGPPIITRGEKASKKLKKLLFKGAVLLGGLGAATAAPIVPGVIAGGRRKRKSPPSDDLLALPSIALTPSSDYNRHSYDKEESISQMETILPLNFTTNNETTLSLFDSLPFQGAPIPKALRKELSRYMPPADTFSDAECLQQSFCENLVELDGSPFQESFLFFYSALSPEVDHNQWLQQSLTAAKKKKCSEFYCTKKTKSEAEEHEDFENYVLNSSEELAFENKTT